MGSTSTNGHSRSHGSPLGSLEQQPEWPTEPIAIVGVSCKFAGDANSTEGFWKMITEGRTAWSEPPLSRWNAKGAYHADKDKLSTTSVKGAHFLDEDPGAFDAAFFSYSGNLAAAVDPQYRMQLESAYEALENAGISLAQVAGSRTSCYTAVMTHDYHDGLMRDGDNLPRFLPVGTLAAVSANRISHFFDLRGTSFTLDTGCSGGIVALHQAVLGLRAREADMAVVSGCNLMLSPDQFKMFSSLGMLSPDGISYAFDSRANGYGRGEGVGTIVLKRLRDAIEAGDPVRAVIRESSLNQDGKTDTITQPSETAQIQLMRDCYARAGLDPSGTQYFEAHGTGTPTGDPIEARAIAAVFGSHTDERRRTQPLRIGSVKTNIGHTEAASGLAAVIKVVLAMERDQLPPSVNYDKANREMRFDEWGLQVATQLEPWPAAEGEARRASINNFGFGGTNSHVILEDARSVLASRSVTKTDGHVDSHTNGTTSSQDAEKRSEVLVFYGRDEQACQRMVSGTKAYLETQLQASTQNMTPAKLMRDLIFTLNSRRTRFPSGWVSAHVVPCSDSDLSPAIKSLDTQSQQSSLKPVRLSSKPPRIGMVFTGQGAQWYGMARELIRSYRVFRETLDEAQAYLDEFGAGWSLVEELMRDAETTRVNTTALSIPICVAVQIALIRLLKAWGIEPTAVTSHSSGEIAASYTVGALSLRQAMAAGHYRALLAAEKSLKSSSEGGPKGAMVALGVGQLVAQEGYVDKLTPDGGKAVVACVNSPTSVTIAGDERAVQQVLDMAVDKGVFARRLKVDQAYHSHHMMPLSEPYRETLRAAAEEDGVAKSDNMKKRLDIIFSSPVTGGRVTQTKQLVDPDHLVKSLVQPVEFVDAFTDMVLGDLEKSSRSNIDLVIEVGPHTALGGPIKEILSLPEFQGLDLPYMGCLKRQENARDCMLSMAVSLIRKGYPVDVSQLSLSDSDSRVGKPSILTNLPPYPWNHAIRHWDESRIHRAYLQRDQGPHHLLGMPVPGANPDAAAWRQRMRVSEHRWLEDHVIQGAILWPGAGFVCLAIEAMKQQQLVASKKDNTLNVQVAGYRLRQVEIHQALVVPDDDNGIEVQTVLRSVSDKVIGARGWKEFEVLSITAESRWTQHAKGFIMVDFTRPDNSTSTSNPLDDAVFIRRIDPDDMWAGLHKLGMCHGPSFQNTKSIVQNGSAQDGVRVAVTTIGVADCATDTQSPSKHLLHPTTLDSIWMGSYAALPSAGATDDAAKVPRSIQKLWVSATMPTAAGHVFTCNTNLVHASTQTMQADITVIDSTGAGQAVVEVEGLVCQSLGRSATASQDQQQQQKLELATKIEWGPDLQFSMGLPGASEAAKAKLSPPRSVDIDAKDKAALMLLRRVCVYFCHDAVQELEFTNKALAKLEPQHVKYYQWMKEVLGLARSCQLGPDSDTWTRDSQLVRERNIALVESQSVDGELIGRLGPLLVPMLRGEKKALEVMIQDQLLSKYTSDALRLTRGFVQFAELLRAVVHKNPRARVLQIGAGSRGATRHALKALGTDAEGGPFVHSWHFTDTDSGSFEAARAEFATHSSFLDMQFDQLDIEKDPAAQGFALESYDLVVACRALSLCAAHDNMAQAMTNIYRLMKPGAQLLFMETTQNQIDVQFIHGLLPDASSIPCLSPSSWQKFLKDAGFNGIDVELVDYETEQDMRSVSSMLASVPPLRLELPENSSAAVVTTNKAPLPAEWLQSLRESIASVSGGSLPTVHPLEYRESEESYRDKFCIFVGEIDRPLLVDLDAAALEAIKMMATTCKGLVWVTRGGAVQCTDPRMALASGFARVLRNEYVGRKFITLDLDPGQDAWSHSDASVIAHVVQRGLGSPVGGASSGSSSFTADESELALRDGLFVVPRIYKDAPRNKMLSLDTPDWANVHALPDAPLDQQDRPLRLHVGMPGMLDSLVFADDEAYEDYADDDTIEIDPRAYGVNFRDVMVVLDQLRERVMGMEVAGVISRLGSEASAQGFAVGDRVFGFLRGPFASRARIGWHAMAHIPEGMSFEDAASLPMVFGTAYECLVNVARIQPGQSVLIHAAAGGVGQAAIVLAKDYLGAEVYVTCGSQEKRELLMREYDLPADRIFNSRNASFAPGILAATGGRGVDVVLNSLAGPLLQASFDVLAPFGHMVEIGKRDLESNSLLDMATFSRVASYTSVDMIRIFENRRIECHRLISEVARLAGQGIVRPVRSLSTYPISEAAKAFRLLQTGKQMGKVVLSISPDQQVKVLPRVPKATLKPDASYLLVGGVGGIGRSAAFWMASHGAKNLIVLSRSAGKVDSSFVAGLGELGCRVVALSCDITNADDLTRALRACKRQEPPLPPIRGVVQGAMVLQDSILENMTMDDWQAAIQPKVAGTWNLHSHFSRPGSLDFFVMLSSLSAIFGWASQSSYAAGGTYEDALARLRVAQGLPAVSLDLGVVVNVGNEALIVTNKLAKSGQSWLLTDELVMQALGSAILQPLQQAQVLYGLNPGPGPHWDAANSVSPMGREALFMALRYRQPASEAIRQTQGYEDGSDGSAKPLSTRLQEAGSADEAKQVVGEAIATKLAEIFMIATGDIDMNQPPASFGVDSLVAVELRNMLMLRAAADMPIFNILQSESLTMLVGNVVAKSAYVAPEYKVDA